MTKQSEVETKQEPKAESPTYPWTESSRKLVQILSYKRPHKSRAEKKFIAKFLVPLGGTMDGCGNTVVKIGEAPILFSSHTDTVHTWGGKQQVYITKGNELCVEDAHSSCLGADDGAGVWLMLEMIAAKVPGVYVFHRGEEVGCIGSKHIAKKQPELLKEIQCAIAFDRRGTDDVITHQRGDRTCSDEFAKSLAAILGGKFSPCSGGVYTDTAEYTDFIGECTNVSVGYSGAHGRYETLDLPFIEKLRDTLIAADWSKLVYKRKPGEKETRTYTVYGGHYYGESRYNGHKNWHYDDSGAYYSRTLPAKNEYNEGKPFGFVHHGKPSIVVDDDGQSAVDFGTPPAPMHTKSTKTLAQWCRDYPDVVADFLETEGYDADTIRQYINDAYWEHIGGVGLL